MNPIVIIGSGMAGYTVAREFRKLDSQTPLQIITTDNGVNYAKPTLSNALVGKKQPAQIALGDSQKMATQLVATIQTDSMVSAIDTATKTITLQTKDAGEQTINYQALVLALGATPIRLPIEGDGAAEILVVNTLDDYHQFRTKLDNVAHSTKRILIIGAGLIGCEFANDLVATEHQVTVVDLAPTPLGRLLPSDAAALYQQKLTAAGINFQLATTVQSITRQVDSNQVMAYQVTLANGQTITADVVLSAIGLKANTALASSAGIACTRGIMGNSFLQTSAADVYAVGDCAEIEGHFLPYVMPIMQQARSLAQTLAGNATPVHYPAMPVAVKTPAAPLVILPPPIDLEVQWHIESLEDGLIAKALNNNSLRGYVLLGSTAGKQRLELTKQVPDLLFFSV